MTEKTETADGRKLRNVLRLRLKKKPRSIKQLKSHTIVFVDIGRTQEHGTFSIADEVPWKHLSAEEQTQFSKAIETAWQGVLDFKAVTIMDSTQRM